MDKMLFSAEESDRPAWKATVRDPRVFHAFVRQEKLRADRNGTGFAFVVFEMEDAQLSLSRKETISKSLLTGLRSIDEIGWLDDKSIGILLPATSNEGCRQFLQRVAAVAKPSARGLRSSVYAYPGQWPFPSESESGKD